MCLLYLNKSGNKIQETEKQNKIKIQIKKKTQNYNILKGKKRGPTKVKIKIAKEKLTSG